MASANADRPTADDGLQYHLETAEGSIAPYCLIVGSPGRAEMVAEHYFQDVKQVGGWKKYGRYMLCYTGTDHGLPVSVVTTNMGSPTTGIVLTEIARCGARRIIRVGSCSALQKGPKPGDVTIWTGAVRLEGTSKNWAPIEYPAVADYRMVAALVMAAKRSDIIHHVGIGATTDDFNEGQARPDDSGWIPPRMLELHRELTHRGVIAYSMEEACLFVWATTHGDLRYVEGHPRAGELVYHGGIWAGAVDAVYGNRQTNEFVHCGEPAAIEIALDALLHIRHEYPL